MRCGRSRASLPRHSLLVSRGVPVPVCCGVPLPLSFLSGASYSVIAPLQAASLPLRRSLPASSPLRCPGPPLCHCVPAGQQLCRSAGQQHLPDGSPPRRPGQQHLPDGTLPHCSRPAAPPRRPGQQLRYGAPASNKPHLAEKSTPVWLAIWRTWAGFANSQLQRAAFRSTY